MTEAIISWNHLPITTSASHRSSAQPSVIQENDLATIYLHRRTRRMIHSGNVSGD
jgi:hypothetical protein